MWIFFFKKINGKQEAKKLKITVITQPERIANIR